MILIVAAIVSIPIALIRGGRLAALADIEFRYGWLAFAALAIQIAVVYLPWLGANAAIALLTLSHGLLIGLAFINRKLPGLSIVAAGLLVNVLAMIVNGGFMPVTPQALNQAGLGSLVSETAVGDQVLGPKDIILPRDQVRLWMLTDILAIGAPINTVLSIGDIFLAAGIFWMFQQGMCPEKLACQVTADSGARN